MQAVAPLWPDAYYRPAMLGKVVDERYRLVRLLGTGGMGNVYEAVHQGTGRRVALKVIANAELASDVGAIARFQREAKAAGSIDTEHIAEVLDAGTDRVTGMPYIAMEFLVGNDLKALSERLGPLDTHLALRIVSQACAGLQKAHESGIVHRDIKPANLFLAREPDGRLIVKVLDFGIAKLPTHLLAGGDALSATTTGRLLGSPLFMSPEQIRGLRTLDHRTDIWSLGAVLYETLAGRPPFAECETVGQLMVAICSQQPPALDLIAPWLQPDVVAIVDRALQINPDERYPSAAAMQGALLALLPTGTEIDEGQLMSASGQRSPSLWYDDASSVGTQSLDDEERFLVEPPSPRLDSADASRTRAESPPGSGSTLPSASGERRAIPPKAGRIGPMFSAFALLCAAAAGVWFAVRREGPNTPSHVQPTNPSAEVHAATLEALPPPPATVAIDSATHAEPGASTIEPRKRAAIGPSAKGASAPPTPPASAAFTATTLPSAAAGKQTPTETAPAISASVEPPVAESPWKLDRTFPAKKASP
ncbi:MAG TPA: serine/threonine-protein kinase [Polyangiaceae bacterium]